MCMKYMPKFKEIRNRFSYVVSASYLLMFVSCRVHFEAISACYSFPINHRYYRKGKLASFLNNISDIPQLMVCKIHINSRYVVNIAITARSIIFLSFHCSFDPNIHLLSSRNAHMQTLSLHFPLVWNQQE